MRNSEYYNTKRQTGNFAKTDKVVKQTHLQTHANQPRPFAISKQSYN